MVQKITTNTDHTGECKRQCKMRFLKLEIKSTNNKDEVIAIVKHGGILSSNKGVNLPNTKISLPCLTPKDLVDLEFALQMNIAWVGLSFVRNAQDIITLKELITKANSKAKVIWCQ